MSHPNNLHNLKNLATALALALTQHQQLGCQFQQVSEALPKGVAIGGDYMRPSVLNGSILSGSTLAPTRPHLHQTKHPHHKWYGLGSPESIPWKRPWQSQPSLPADALLATLRIHTW